MSIVTVATLTVALAAAPASAEPPEPAGGATADRVTLLTGDVVEVAAAGGGRYAATVQPGPGRESVTFHTTEVDGRLLVLPSDVVPYLSAGVLDDRLFDVPELLAQGYGDAELDALPLIVRYEAGALSTAGEALESIGGAALAPDKDTLGDLWAELAKPVRTSATEPPKLGGGVAEIWLDGRVTPVLDRSAGQVGAPAAWRAGYDGSGVDIAVLDTGVDESHPDLSGRVSATGNFTDSPTAEDQFGHGTHVAAIAAGTGAGSDGARPGVAPGANLLAGKVLNDDGFGYDSWIIAGMEWAVAEGAEIVNLSLGGGATDGTDPLSQAVNRLSTEHGTLFVIAAGNDGADYAVGTPGAATTALTVGAVDRADELASFSSRGPRVADNAPKPEITAPGVGIVAARAAGTGLGTPVDEHYTAVSGTSMATPHVAGAAALLAQAHPDWDGAALKDALVSTAQPHPDLPVYAQGGGRLDAARAVTQRLHATGVLDLGMHTQDAAKGTVDATLSYTNHTAASVTLELVAELTNLDRSADASGALSLPAQVAVPAGTTVDVTLQLDPGQLERGRHSGRVTATGPDGLVARTALATTLAGRIHSVTFRAVAADGSPAGADVLMLHGDDPRTDGYGWILEGGKWTMEVEEGTYLLHALIPDYDPQYEQVTLVTDPELEVTGDMEVVLDAGTAAPVRIETPQPAEQRAVFSYYVHRELSNGRTISHGTMHFSTVQQLNVTPTAPLSAGGGYEFSSRWQLVAPMVDVEVAGFREPLDVNLLHRSPAFEGQRQFRLVWGGTGTPAELTKAAGAAVLMEGVWDRSEEEQVAAAADAGAAAALIVRPPDFPAWTVWRPVGDREPIPAMVVGHDGGTRLIAHARSQSRPRINLTLTTVSPYLYDVMHVETGQVPEQIVHRVTRDNSARSTVAYTDTGGFEWLKEQRFGWRPWQTYAWNDSQRFTLAGTVRDEWVSAGDTLWQHRVQHEYTWDDMNPLQGGMAEAPAAHPAGLAAPTTWFGPVVRPATPVGVPGLVSTRTGDTLALRIPEFVDGTGAHYELTDYEPVEARLLRDGELVAELPDARRDVPTVPDPARYRLELTTERESDEWQWGTRTETAWEFDSQRPAAGTEPLPLLQVDYDVPADLTGQVAGRWPHLLGLSLREDGPATAREVRLAVSFDEGETWRTIPVWRVGQRMRALIPGTGQETVSLRVEAEATDGSTVTQTVIRAYGLT
jgi:subtilisin family serine protease